MISISWNTQYVPCLAPPRREDLDPFPAPAPPRPVDFWPLSSLPFPGLNNWYYIATWNLNTCNNSWMLEPDIFEQLQELSFIN